MAANFNVPEGAVANVRIIDTTTSIKQLAVKFLMTPPIPGFDILPELPTWSFLVESDMGKKALFDLGVPPDWETFAPAVLNRLTTNGWEVKADKHVVDILKENQVDPASINSIVWSHWHWDHLGDPSTFPGSTELVVGPGFKEAFFPGYPGKEDAPVRESDFRGREVREIDFDGPNVIKIGQLRAVDFFGDGSFYLLDTPGHAVGHIAGLARTTPDSFILMGGDLCHHGGEIRPSPYIPLPDQVRLSAFAHLAGGVCPGAELESLQKSRSRAIDEPFYDPSMGLDIAQAIETIKKTQEADAVDHVLFIYAHDTFIRGKVDMFPKSINDWKSKGLKEKLFWDFLQDFAPAIKGKE
ncbi:hypothetical protein B0A52_05339 [Exophiala mesophila]|uniref:Metallo-beta-lactamase domain-containing protein n=1 Tax=Exophiala mesophila TaxID=212818 RepID=A0A438N4P1_EXOME|nr:hypothetical protein B0A52_05339 [Exophiala mesophila]